MRIVSESCFLYYIKRYQSVHKLFPKVLQIFTCWPKSLIFGKFVSFFLGFFKFYFQTLRSLPFLGSQQWNKALVRTSFRFRGLKMAKNIKRLKILNSVRVTYEIQKLYTILGQVMIWVFSILQKQKILTPTFVKIILFVDKDRCFFFISVKKYLHPPQFFRKKVSALLFFSIKISSTHYFFRKTSSLPLVDGPGPGTKLILTRPLVLF